jgi:hypothetical protein
VPEYNRANLAGNLLVRFGGKENETLHQFILITPHIENVILFD